MKFIHGVPTIDHNNGYEQYPVKEQYYCKGIAAQEILQKHGATLFRAEPEFNYFQVPPDKVVIGVVFLNQGEFAITLQTRPLFEDFFRRVKDERRFFQTLLIAKTEISKLFAKGE